MSGASGSFMQAPTTGWRHVLNRYGTWFGILLFVLLVAFRPVAQLFESRQQGVRLVIWHSQRGAERETLESLLHQFNQRNQGRVYISPLGVPENSLKDKLVRNVPRGSGPDLFIRPHNELGELQLEGVVAPVGEARELERTWYPQLLDGLSIDGKPYGLPLTYKGLFLFYNKALCPEGPPTDISQLASMRERLPEGVFPLAYDAANFFFHAPFFIGNGERIFGDQMVGEGLERGHRFALLDSWETSSFRWPGQWKKAGVIPSQPDYNEAVRLFQAGKAAVIINGPWYSPRAPEGDESRMISWDMAPLFDVDGRATGSLITVEGLFLSSRSQHPAEALEAARFLAGPVGGAARYLDLGQPPSTLDSSALGSGDDPRDELRHKMVLMQQHALENGVVTPNEPRMASVWTPARDILSASVAGRDLEQARQSAQRELDKVDLVRSGASGGKTLGIVLAALLILGTWRLVFLARQELHGDDARRAHLTGFHGRAALPFLIPGSLAVILLVFIPLMVGAGMSLFAHEYGTFSYVGLGNFKEILLVPFSQALQARSFYYSLAVTILWTLSNVVFHVGIGMALAILLRPSWNRLRTVYRVILILPWAIPNYITALMWKGMFNAQVGAVNLILSALGLDFAGHNWFDRFSYAFTANLVTNMWLGFPFMMVVTLGALQSIPAEQEEAAILDGASRWQRFKLVILPHIKPALVPSIILGITWTFNAFNIIYLVSGGDPGSQTDILVSEAYRWAFERGQKYGYAAAYSVLIFLFLFGYSWFTNRMQKAERP